MMAELHRSFRCTSSFLLEKIPHTRAFAIALETAKPSEDGVVPE